MFVKFTNEAPTEFYDSIQSRQRKMNKNIYQTIYMRAASFSRRKPLTSLDYNYHPFGEDREYTL